MANKINSFNREVGEKEVYNTKKFTGKISSGSRPHPWPRNGSKRKKHGVKMGTEFQHQVEEIARWGNVSRCEECKRGRGVKFKT